MTAKIIDGKAIAEELRRELTSELKELKAAGAQPGIATLMVGDDFGAGMYRGAVEKFCGEMGLGYRSELLPSDATDAAVVAVVQSLNADPAVSGILPLRPFPAQVPDSLVIQAIVPDKDVDCFHPFNMGRLALGERTFPPPRRAPAWSSWSASSRRRARTWPRSSKEPRCAWWVTPTPWASRWP